MKSLDSISNIKDYIFEAFTSNIVERFFFSIICATAFTASFCHWLLDLSYKYKPTQEGTLHIDFTWVFWICFVVVLYYLIRNYLITNKIVKFDLALILLCQSFIFVGILDYHNEQYPSIPYAWILPMGYIIGKYAIGTEIHTVEKNIEKIYFCLAFGSVGILTLDLIQLCLFVKDWGVPFTQIYTLAIGEWPGFLTNDGQNRCTMEFGAVLITSALGYTFMKIREHKILCISTIIASFICILFSFLSTGRGVIVLLALSIGTFAFMLLLDKRKHIPRKAKLIVLLFFIAMFIFVSIILLAIDGDWFGIKDMYLNSYWSRDGGIINNVRFSIDWNGFISMLQYPLDNYEEIAGLARPHSMLLEYGRVYGISVYIGLVLFRVITFLYAFLLLQKKDAEIKYLLIPAFICVNAYYSMEPNGHALKYFWLIGLLISGFIASTIDSGS